MISNLLVSVIASVGIVQGFFLALFLMIKRERKNDPNFFLGMALMGLTIRILKSVLNYYFVLGPKASSLGISAILFAGPFLWMYGQSILSKESLNRKVYFHLLPFFIFVICIPFASEVFHRYFNYWIAVVHFGFYVFLGFRELLIQKQEAGKLKFSWYRKILLGALAVWSFYLLNIIRLDIHYLTGPIFYVFIMYGFTLLLLNREHLEINKYDYSTLSGVDADQLYRRLMALFEKDDTIIQSELSLQGVASKLSTTPRLISQIINEKTQHNFRSFINEFRVEKAKRLLNQSNYVDQKIATIAYECGFNNVTSFNVAFKKSTGQTPSEYRKLTFH